MVSKKASALRFRHSSAITVAAIIAMIAGISVGSWQPYLLVLEVIPLAVAVWSWRAGTDVDEQAVTVRAAVGSRRVPWAEVAELRRDGKGHLEAVLTSGGRLTLTAVPAEQLMKLVAVAGTELPVAERAH